MDTSAPNRIAELRKAKGWTQDQLARACRPATTQPQIKRLESGERRLTQEWMGTLSTALNVNPADLLPAKPRGDAKPGDNNQRKVALETTDALALGDEVRPVREDAPVMSEQENLPVYGYVAGVGEDEYFFTDQGHEMTRTIRPMILKGVKDAYAVDVYGDSMKPRFEAGNRLWVHPRRPTKPGDDVVVQLDDERAIVKRLVRKTEKFIILEQFNPPKEIKLARKDVKQIDLVVGLLLIAT